MRPTEGGQDRPRLARLGEERVEPGVGVGLQDPAPAGEMLSGMLAAPVAIYVRTVRRRRSSPWWRHSLWKSSLIKSR
jgi:hypothetical protein